MLERLRTLFPGVGEKGTQEQTVSLEHLREILDTIEVKFAQMKAEYGSYRESTEVQLQKAADLEKSASRLQAENLNLTQQLDDAERRSHHAEQATHTQREELASLRSALEREQGERTALVRQLHALEEQSRVQREQQPVSPEAHPQWEEMQASREYWETRARDQEKQLAALQEAQAQLKQRFEAEVAKRAGQEPADKLARRQAEYDQLALQLERANQEIQELGKRWQLEHAERQVLEDRLRQSSAELAGIQAMHERLKLFAAEQQGWHEERAGLLQQVQVLRDERTALEARLAAGTDVPLAPAPSSDRRQLLRQIIGH